MSSDGERNKAGMWSRTSVCRPRVHLIETALDEGRGDQPTTSMGEGVMRSVILRYLRRRSTSIGPSRMAPERQAACGMAWMVALQEERRRLVGKEGPRRAL